MLLLQTNPWYLRHDREYSSYLLNQFCVFIVGHVSPHYNHIKTLAASDVKHMDLIKYSRAVHKGPNRFD